MGLFKNNNMKIEIKHRHTDAVLFNCEDAVDIRDALQKAAALKVDLSSANLSSANLSSANLSYAGLRYADLRYADLSSANLRYADLRYADLTYADLSSANLSSADLRSANLSSANLSSANLSYADLSYADLRYADLSSADGGRNEIKALLHTGPIGSRNDHAICFNTDKGLIVRAGCFNDTMEKFKESVEKNHGDSKHGRNYRAWINLCEEWSKE